MAVITSSVDKNSLFEATISFVMAVMTSSVVKINLVATKNTSDGADNF